MDGRLIASKAFDDTVGSGMMAIRLNEDIARLLSGDVTYLEWWIRLTLSGDLVRWLHNFLSSHTASVTHPLYIGYSKLHELTESTASRKEFRRMVRECLNELQAAGVVEDWWVNQRSTLHIVKRPASVRKRKNQEARRLITQLLNENEEAPEWA